MFQWSPQRGSIYRHHCKCGNVLHGIAALSFQTLFHLSGRPNWPAVLRLAGRRLANWRTSYACHLTWRCMMYSILVSSGHIRGGKEQPHIRQCCQIVSLNTKLKLFWGMRMTLTMSDFSKFNGLVMMSLHGSQRFSCQIVSLNMKLKLFWGMRMTLTMSDFSKLNGLVMMSLHGSQRFSYKIVRN